MSFGRRIAVASIVAFFASFSIGTSSADAAVIAAHGSVRGPMRVGVPYVGPARVVHGGATIAHPTPARPFVGPVVKHVSGTAVRR